MAAAQEDRQATPHPVFRDLITGALKAEALPDTGNIVLPPESYPPIETLKKRAGERAPA